MKNWLPDKQVQKAMLANLLALAALLPWAYWQGGWPLVIQFMVADYIGFVLGLYYARGF